MESAFAYQSDLFIDHPDKALGHPSLNSRSGAFGDNMSLPVHRWFRYSAGFSADWVKQLICDGCAKKKQFTVLDPFAGVGTTLLASEAMGVKSWGFETHPFIHRMATAKLKGIHADIPTLREMFEDFSRNLPNVSLPACGKLPILLTKCYTPHALSQLFAMRNLYLSEFDLKTPESELIWLVITSILRVCSGAGTAQWQYVLPNKRKSSVQSPVTAFQIKATEILTDIEYAQHNNWSSQGEILLTDARKPICSKKIQSDAVITSPPYPNNYDYADATRLEMTFWGEIEGWGDLHSAVRQYLIRSCSQHAAADKLVLEEVLADPTLNPIQKELSDACYALAQIRETKGGKKTYHTMAAAYFRDLGLVLKALRPLCRKNSIVCFVIGDSAPYGVYLEVDTWLGELALAAGFHSYSFEKIRDRNVKWKNRKHRVPLKEGRLWIKG